VSQNVVGIGKWQGLNAAEDPSLLATGECSEMSNVETSTGVVRRRPGFRLLSAEAVADANWPPYLPPVETPEVSGLTFFDVQLPTLVIAGDAFALRLEAQDRTGSPITTFADGTGLALVIQADDGGGWEAFAGLLLVGGGSPDPTAGWDHGVWEQQVVVADIADYYRLKVGLSLDSTVRAEDTAVFAELAEIVVDLPAAVTPAVAFKLQLEARDANAATLLEYTGSGLSLLAMGTDEATQLALLDEAGAAVDVTQGWANGRWSKMVVLADPLGQDGFLLDAMKDAASLGGSSANITQLWQTSGPTTLQSYQQATLKVRARTATAADWKAYDGSEAEWAVELRAPDGTWAAYTGLTDENGDALDISTGWVDGVWEKTIRFDEADGSYIRLVFTSYGIEQWTWQIAVWPVASGDLLVPAACAAATAFAVKAVVLDERGYLLTHYLGENLTLTAEDGDGVAVALTDADGVALDLTTGWDEGVWSGQVMFAATGLEELVLTLSWNGTALLSATLVVGESAPGEVASIQLWAAATANPGEPFALVLAAYDSFGLAVTDYDGTGLALRAVGRDAETGDEIALTLAADALAAGWSGGVWQGEATLADPEACETMRVIAVLAGEDDGEAEVAIAMTFALSVPATVQTSNTFMLSILAVNPDGGAAADYQGADLELQVLLSSGGSWVETSIGTIHLADVASWTLGRFAQSFSAPALGTYKFVLLHQEEEEATATMIVTADMVSDDIDDLGEEDEEEEEEEEPTVVMEVSLPGTVWPGCQFTIGVTASVEGSLNAAMDFDVAAMGGTISVSPEVTPQASLDSGWDGVHWSHTCKLASPASTGSLLAIVSSPPAIIPEGRAPSDYVDSATAIIGEPEFTVSLPATMRPGISGTLRLGITGNGGRLTNYEGDGFSMRVEKSVAGVWSVDAGALITSTGGALPTTWTNGAIQVQVKLGTAIGNAEGVRVVALFNGVEMASDEAEIVSRWQADVTGVTYLHPYLPAQNLTIAVETWGADFAPGDVAVAVEGRQGGAWVAFPYLTDGFGQAMDWGANWTGKTFSSTVAISQAGEFTAVRIRVSRLASQIGELEFAVAEDMNAILTAAALAYAEVPFDLDILVKDRRGNTLTLYDGTGASLGGECLGEEGATMTAGSVATGWSDGQWFGQATISAACETFRITLSREAVFTEALGSVDVSVQALSVAVIAAIRERQMAMGVSPLIDVEGTYTLTGLVAEANKFTPALGGTGSHFWLLASWAEGAANAPTSAVAAVYFGEAGSGKTCIVANAKELYDGVVTFRRTAAVNRGGWGCQHSYSGSYGPSAYGADPDEVIDDAKATWAAAGAPARPDVATGLYRSGGYHSARCNGSVFGIGSGLGVSTQVGRNLSVYIKGSDCEGTGDREVEFTGHGIDVLKGVYFMYAEATLGAGVDNAVDGPHWSAYPEPPTDWFHEAPNNNWWYLKGWGMDAASSVVVLVDWSFDF